MFIAGFKVLPAPCPILTFVNSFALFSNVPSQSPCSRRRLSASAAREARTLTTTPRTTSTCRAARSACPSRRVTSCTSPARRIPTGGRPRGTATRTCPSAASSPASASRHSQWSRTGEGGGGGGEGTGPRGRGRCFGQWRPELFLG